MPFRTDRVEDGASRPEFAHGASQQAGRFSSLSLAQFGSKTLAGEPINQVSASGITVGQLTGPLPHKSSTMGTNNTLTSWRKQGVLPYSAATSQSTFQN